MLFANGTVAALFLSSIAINLLVSILVGFFSIRTKQLKFISLLAFTLLASVYQWFTWHYHAAIDTDDAVYWLKWQTNLVTLIMIPYYLTFACWLNNPRFIQFSKVIAACGIALFVYGLFKSLPLRFDEVVELRKIPLFGDEHIALLKGNSGLSNYLLHGYVASTLVSMLSMAVVAFTNHKRGVSLALALLSVLQITGTSIGLAIDMGRLNLFYVAGFVVIFIDVVICVALASEALSNAESLRVELRERNRLERAISQLAKGFRGRDAKRFYESMLRSLFEMSAARQIFIGLKDDSDGPLQIRTRCVLRDGEVVDNFSYALVGSPCELILNNKLCVVEKGVAQRFPEVKLLSKYQFESYIGVPLLGESGIEGVLVLLHDKPLSSEQKFLQTLEVFAARATAEIRREQIENRLREMAYLDLGMQLPNQARLFEVLGNSYEHDQQQGSSSVLMLFDLDRFTEVNRNYGYDVGEYVLQVLGKRLAAHATDNLFIARNAGDEFAVVIPQVRGLPHATIGIHWERIRNLVREPIHIDGVVLIIDCSMGAVQFPEQTRNRYDVIRAAEIALQQAKDAGRGSMRYFDPQELAHLDRQREIERGLVSALLVEDQLAVVYQPKVNPQGECRGAEALLRWQHPKYGAISPAEFIAVAENSSLIFKLGAWAINQVCGQVETWLTQGLPDSFVVSINISALYFADDDFINSLMDTVARYNIAPRNIELELTETCVLQSLDSAVQKLHRLNKEGFTVSLDDFGTGYSSLSYLSELPVHALKVDKSFVDKIDDESSAELFRAIITIGKLMGLLVVAEGTETAEQVDKIADMGCELFQGYYFSPPLPAEVFVTWCKAGRLPDKDRLVSDNLTS